MSNLTMPQRERLRQFFQAHKNEWIPLPDILKLGIAQYNSRVWDLRREGMQIENKVIEIVNGERHTAFKYIPAQFVYNNNQAEFALAREV